MDAGTRALLVARLRSMGAAPADAEDAVQEALAELWTRKANNHPIEHPLAWLTIVARNKYVDLLRRRAREAAVGLCQDDVVDRTAPGPEEQVVARTHAIWLVDRLRGLPLVTQEVCQRTGGDTHQSDTAAALGLTSRSVESHLTRARRLLRIQSALSWATVLAAVASAWRRTSTPRWSAVTSAAGAAVASVGLSIMPGTDAIEDPPAAAAIAVPAQGTSDRPDGPPALVHPVTRPADQSDTSHISDRSDPADDLQRADPVSEIERPAMPIDQLSMNVALPDGVELASAVPHAVDAAPPSELAGSAKELVLNAQGTDDQPGCRHPIGTSVNSTALGLGRCG